MKPWISLLFVASLSVPALASSLQDWQFNVNGTSYFPANGNTFASVSGLSTTAFNEITGQGTLTLTYKPGAAGTYYVGAYFFDPVGVPFYNEYGMVNGSATLGQTWQIDVPQYSVISANHGPGTIVDNLSAQALDNTNHITGTTSNYLNNCGANTSGAAAGATCNDFVSMAMGFTFTLTAAETETVTVKLSTANPGGFSLEAVHPVDGSNPSAANLYYSGSAVVGSNPPPPPPNSPEPATWSLLAIGGVLAFGFGLRRRTSKQ